jgi:hypothetical protein
LEVLARTLATLEATLEDQAALARTLEQALSRTLEALVQTLATLGELTWILEPLVPVAAAVVEVLLLEAHLELVVVVVEVLPLEAHLEPLLSFHQEEEELLHPSHWTPLEHWMGRCWTTQ